MPARGHPSPLLFGLTCRSRFQPNHTPSPRTTTGRSGCSWHVLSPLAAPGDARSGFETAAVNDDGRGSDVDDDADGTSRAGDSVDHVSNLFERFAARVPSPPSPARNRGGNRQREPRQTTEKATCRTPRTDGGGGAAAAENGHVTVPGRSGAFGGEDTERGDDDNDDDDDDVSGAQHASPVAVPPSSPSPTRNSRRDRDCRAGQASPAGGAGAGVFDEFRAGLVANHGETACCATTARNCSGSNSLELCVAISKRRKSGGAGDRKTVLREDAAGAAVVAGRMDQRGAGKLVAGVVGVTSLHVFEQFAYSPSE